MSINLKIFLKPLKNNNITLFIMTEFKCDLCSYTTSRKHNFTTHLDSRKHINRNKELCAKSTTDVLNKNIVKDVKN